jgi:hypothetical protein
MNMMKRANQNTGLWWLAVASLSIGLSIFILLKPAEYDLDVRRYRSLALVLSFAIAGLCVIIATRRRWFGKGL